MAADLVTRESNLAGSRGTTVLRRRPPDGAGPELMADIERKRITVRQHHKARDVHDIFAAYQALAGGASTGGAR